MSDYAHRAHSSSLAKFDITHLRNITEQYGLDATNLRFKRQYISTLAHHLHKHNLPLPLLPSLSSSTKPTKPRPTFLTLPAELRNAIYATVLTCPHPITIHFASDGQHMHLHARMIQQSRWTYNLRSIPHPDLLQIRTFAALSLVSAQVNHEVRTYFYAHNAVRFNAVPFCIPRLVWPRADVCIIHAPPYLAAYAEFLGRMGKCGRAVVRDLCFEDGRERREDFDYLVGCEHFFSLLQECWNLTSLTLGVTADHVTAGDSEGYYGFLIGRGTIPRKALRAFADRFSPTHLPRLRRLMFTYTICPREYLAYDITAVGRKRRNPLMCALVAQRIEMLMDSLKGLVERRTNAEVKIRRVPFVRMQPAKWRDVNATKEIYVRRYCGLKRGSLQEVGDGRVDWEFEDGAG